MELGHALDQTTYAPFEYTAYGNPDTDGDGVESSFSQLPASEAGMGLLDGGDITLHRDDVTSYPYSSWLNTIHYDFDGEFYRFYGEQPFGTFPNRNGFDTDGDKLLDGWNVTVDTNNDPRGLYELFGPSVVSVQNGSLYTFLGERDYNADPLDSDSDNDTILDGEELNGSALIDGQSYTFNVTNPTRNDTDFDSLLDQIELTVHGTDPASPDTDGDGALDNMELEGWLVRVSQVGSDEWLTYDVTSDPFDNDTDNDGLLDGPEYLNGTDPRKADTDGDRLGDLYEAQRYNGSKSTTDFNPFAQEITPPNLTSLELKPYKNKGDFWVVVSYSVIDNSGLDWVSVRFKSPISTTETDYFQTQPTGAGGSIRFDMSVFAYTWGQAWQWEVELTAVDHLNNSAQGSINQEGRLKDNWVVEGFEWLLDKAEEAREALEGLLDWLREWFLQEIEIDAYAIVPKFVVGSRAYESDSSVTALVAWGAAAASLFLAVPVVQFAVITTLVSVTDTATVWKKVNIAFGILSALGSIVFFWFSVITAKAIFDGATLGTLGTGVGPLLFILFVELTFAFFSLFVAIGSVS